MSYDDPNWNGGYNTSAAGYGASPLSQAGGGVLPTDSPDIAHSKAMVYEQQRRFWDAANNPSNSSGGSGASSYGGGTGPAISLRAIGLLTAMAMALALAWYGLKDSDKWYLSHSATATHLMGRLGGVVSDKEITTLSLMAFMDSHIRAPRSETIERYIREHPSFSKYRSEIAVKLAGPNKLRELSALLGQYRETKAGRSSPDYYALMYFCERSQYYPCSLQGQGAQFFEIEKQDNSVRASLCAAQLDMTIAGLRRVVMPDTIRKYQQTLTQCKQIGESAEINALSRRLVFAGWLASAIHLLPDGFRTTTTVVISAGLHFFSLCMQTGKDLLNRVTR